MANNQKSFMRSGGLIGLLFLVIVAAACIYKATNNNYPTDIRYGVKHDGYEKTPDHAIVEKSPAQTWKDENKQGGWIWRVLGVVLFGVIWYLIYLDWHPTSKVLLKNKGLWLAASAVVIFLFVFVFPRDKTGIDATTIPLTEYEVRKVNGTIGEIFK